MHVQMKIAARSLRRVLASMMLAGVGLAAGFAGGCRGGEQLVLVNESSVAVEVTPSQVATGVGGASEAAPPQGQASVVSRFTLPAGSAKTLDRGLSGDSGASGAARLTRFGVRALPAGSVQWFEVPSLGSFLVRFSAPPGGVGSEQAVLIAIDERSGPAQRDAQDRQVREILDRPRFDGPGR